MICVIVTPQEIEVMYPYVPSFFNKKRVWVKYPAENHSTKMPKRCSHPVLRISYFRITRDCPAGLCLAIKSEKTQRLMFVQTYTWWLIPLIVSGLVHPSDLHGIFVGLIHSKNWGYRVITHLRFVGSSPPSRNRPPISGFRIFGWL